MKQDQNAVFVLIAPLDRNLANVLEHKNNSERNGLSSGLPPRVVQSESVSRRIDCISSNDPLVTKCHQMERKVHESLNKLTCIKDIPMSSRSYLSIDGKSLKADALEVSKPRNTIETEFMKKKIHFVSEFRLYDEQWKLKLIQQQRETAMQYNCLGQSIFSPTQNTYIT